MGREGFEGEGVRVKRSGEKSRGEKGVGDDEKNRGGEKEEGNQHGDQEEQGL